MVDPISLEEVENFKAQKFEQQHWMLMDVTPGGGISSRYCAGVIFLQLHAKLNFNPNILIHILVVQKRSRVKMILFGTQKRDGDDERTLFKKAVGPYELFLSIFFFRNHCLHL